MKHPTGLRPLAGRGLCFVVLTSLLLAPALPRAAEHTTYDLSGLSQNAEIVVDKSGIPHIYANTFEDVFFVQGFNAARDRLWQLDLWRRQGEGKLSEVFGPRFVEQDRAARLFLYRGDLDAEFSSYHPRGKEILTAFTNGINAYVDLVAQNPDLLPVEFQLTGSTPGHWSVTTPLIRIFGLTRNLTREVAFAQLLNTMKPEDIVKVSNFQPSTALTPPAGVDLSLIDSKSIAAYRLARGGVEFKPEDIVGGPAAKGAKLTQAEKVRYAQRLSIPAMDQAMSDNPLQPFVESNNWTIAPKRTSTGGAILSGDPHRAQSVPSLRYIAHISGPGWNVIGAGEPALPGISLGHNDRIAYALTIFSYADEEDLYVYDTNPDNPNQYRYKGAWEDMRQVQEDIPVKGGAAQTVTLKFTRHGPVLSEDTTNHKAYALRAAYLEFPGTAVYLGSLRVDQAQNWTEFQDAMEHHFTPSENMVYADVDGNIGWFGCSIAPIRDNWNGMLPVPGNGDFEWNGFVDPNKLPRIFNPEEGFFASANQYNIPPNFPLTQFSAHEWTDPYRYDRIMEVLSWNTNSTLEDSMRLQYDEYSIPAEQLVPMLGGLTSDDPDVTKALDELTGWDYVLSKDSVEATIFELWVNQLHKDVFALYVPEAARSVFGQGSRQVLIDLLQLPDAAFGADAERGRDQVLLKSLATAVATAKSKLGNDMTQWQWGKLHHMTYEHDLSAAADAGTKAMLDVGPLPMGGDGFTVHNTGYNLSDYNQNTGASYRQVVDLKNFDNSVTLNSPGESGDPTSPHYKDLFPLWAEGKFVPMLFSKGKVMANAEHVYTLRAAKK